MSEAKKRFLYWWLGGIAAFGITLFIHYPLITDTVPGGILDHQAASKAAIVNGVQEAWAQEGLMGRAIVAMVSDLIFIVIYANGAILGGVYFRSLGKQGLKVLGTIAAGSAAVFFVSDALETSLQLIQASRMAGDDDLAGIASRMAPAKISGFIASMLALIAALLVERFSSSAA